MNTLWSATSGITRALKITAVAATALLALSAAPRLHAQSSPAATSFALVNAARADAGLPALTTNSGLNAIAKAQADRMAAKDAIYHNPNLGADADAAGVNWQIIGENVGVGPDANAVHNAFMASPGHHRNIVHTSYNALGVGVATGSDGSVFVAQAFAGVNETPAAAPVAAAPQAKARPAPVQAAPVAPTQTPVTAVAAAQTDNAPADAGSAAPAPNAVVGGVVDSQLVLGN